MERVSRWSSDIPTLYDDTFRGRSAHDVGIASMVNRTCLLAKLEHFDRRTDGSFGICMASGQGAFTNKALYLSIPEAHRPALNPTDSREVVNALTGRRQHAAGSIIMPFVLKDINGMNFRMKLYALVVEELAVPMFIGNSTTFYRGYTAGEGRGALTYLFDFDGVEKRVIGI